ncbi:MAG: hypothetical protein WD993_07650 [Thermoleophilaceae bacterium]
MPFSIAVAGAAIVTGVLAVNPLRVDAVVALLAALAISTYLWRRWLLFARRRGGSPAASGDGGN